jgi:hypothetical protein
MAIKPPDKETFNNWNRRDQQWWIDLETGGQRGPEGTPGFLVYQVTQTVIQYTLNRSGKLVAAEAVSLQEGLKRIESFSTAVGALSRSGIKN